MEIRVRDMKGGLGLLTGTDVNKEKVHKAMRPGDSRQEQQQL